MAYGKLNDLQFLAAMLQGNPFLPPATLEALQRIDLEGSGIGFDVAINHQLESRIPNPGKFLQAIKELTESEPAQSIPR